MPDGNSNFAAETHVGHYRLLVNFLRKRLGSYDEAEEVAQESFLRLHRATAIASPKHAVAFVYKVATNLAIDLGRRKKIENRTFDLNRDVTGCDETLRAAHPVNFEPSQEDILDARQRLAILRRVIVDLPPRRREVFVMHKIHGLCHKEIAEKLGISTHAVEKHIMRALAQCRAEIDSSENSTN